MPKFEVTRQTILTTIMIVEADSIEQIKEVYNNMNHPLHESFLDKFDDVEMSNYNADRGDIEITPAFSQNWYPDYIL